MEARRTAHKRLLTGIHYSSEDSARELKTMPTPAWPVDTASESPEHLRKYLVDKFGAVS